MGQYIGVRVGILYHVPSKYRQKNTLDRKTRSVAPSVLALEFFEI